MKTDKTIISLAIFSIFTFQRCTVFEDNQSQKIISQELTYDSINNKSKLFNVGLETTISYTTKDTNSIDFNNLTLIINNDKYSNNNLYIKIYDIN
jgi:lipopolysaccharide biosynthesis glycosyltransferase